jgi:hypothetical protein
MAALQQIEVDLYDSGGIAGLVPPTPRVEAQREAHRRAEVRSRASSARNAQPQRV